MASEQSNKMSGLSFPVRIGLAALGLLVLFGLYSINRDRLSLEHLAERQEQIGALLKQYPVLLFAAGYLLYTAVTGISLPGAAIMTLLYSWFLQQAYPGFSGLLWAVVLVSFASTSGATLAFLLSRFLFRAAAEKTFGERLATVNATLKREGAFYLFSLRLIPVVPFFVINVVMGLTPIRVGTFWLVSQLGMLPGTCVYVYAGSTLPGPQQILDRGAGGILSTQLVLACILLGLLPLLVKRILAAVRARRTTAPPN